MSRLGFGWHLYFLRNYKYDIFLRKSMPSSRVGVKIDFVPALFYPLILCASAVRQHGDVCAMRLLPQLEIGLEIRVSTEAGPVSAGYFPRVSFCNDCIRRAGLDVVRP